MIGILIIAHDTLPDSLVKAVTHVLGTRPPQFETVSVSASDDPFHLVPTAKEALARLDTGDGVLIFSDIYGATPCNLASKLLGARPRRSGGGRQPADARARVHLSREGHGHDDQEGDLRRV